MHHICVSGHYWVLQKFTVDTQRMCCQCTESTKNMRKKRVRSPRVARLPPTYVEWASSLYKSGGGTFKWKDAKLSPQVNNYLNYKITITANYKFIKVYISYTNLIKFLKNNILLLWINLFILCCNTFYFNLTISSLNDSSHNMSQKRKML